MATGRRLVVSLTCFLATAAACAPVRSKEEALKEHFAQGKSWPQAITTLERSLGPAGLLGGHCRTDLGAITFAKLQTGDYTLEYPTRGAGAPGAAMVKSPEAFAAALGDAFVQSRCTHAELEYEQYAVAVDIEAATIKSAAVSRAR